MGGCSANNCSNHSRNGYRMFQIPKNPERQKEWLINMRRDSWTPGRSSQICSEHFEESQFEQPRADGWKKLKKSAVPTLFNIPNPPEKVTPKRVKGFDNPKPGSILDIHLQDENQFNVEMEYTILELKDGLHLVPSKWLIDGERKCHFPSFSSVLRIERAIERQDDPGTDWKMRKVQKIFGTAATYKKGIKKLSLAIRFLEIDNEVESVDEIEESKFNMEYTILEFRDGLQLVPSKWLIDGEGKCYFPSFSSPLRIDEAIEGQEDPGTDWKMRNVQRIFGNSATYKQGVEKLSVAVSFLEIDDEVESVEEIEKSEFNLEYTILEFKEGMKLVPSKWLIDGRRKCYFPSFLPQLKIDKAIKEQEDPGTDWKMHNVLRIFGYSATYRQGVKKLKVATSFLEIEDSIDEESVDEESVDEI